MLDRKVGKGLPPSPFRQAVAPKLHSELVEAGNDIMVEGEIGAVVSDLVQWWIWPEGFKLWWSQVTVVDMCTLK